VALADGAAPVAGRGGETRESRRLFHARGRFGHGIPAGSLYVIRVVRVGLPPPPSGFQW